METNSSKAFSNSNRAEDNQNAMGFGPTKTKVLNILTVSIACV